MDEGIVLPVAPGMDEPENTPEEAEREEYGNCERGRRALVRPHVGEQFTGDNIGGAILDLLHEVRSDGTTGRVGGKNGSRRNAAATETNKSGLFRPGEQSTDERHDICASESNKDDSEGAKPSDIDSAAEHSLRGHVGKQGYCKQTPGRFSGIAAERVEDSEGKYPDKGCDDKDARPSFKVEGFSRRCK